MPWNFNPYQYGQQYQPQYQPQLAVPQMAPQQAPQPVQPEQGAQPITGDLVFEVFGRDGAEALPVGRNSKVVAFDKVLNVMYRIQTDDAGVKNVIEFDFSPREHAPAPTAEYVTRKDFDALAARVEELASPKPAPRTRKAAVDG